MAVASVRLDYGLAFGTLGAETLDGVVDGLDTITFRQGDYGYLDVLDAECPAALLAVEMDVTVLDPADGGLAAAYLVFCGSAAVLERMNRVMFEQDVEGAEYRGLVHGLQFCFQFGHGYGMSELREFLEYEDAGRGRVDAVGLELLFDSFCCHFLRFSVFGCEDGKKCGEMKDKSSKVALAAAEVGS